MADASPQRIKLMDPGGGLDDYVFEVNPDTEEAQQITRNITHTSNTRRTGLVRQQGDPVPIAFTFSGAAFKQHQLTWMLKYFDACNTRTIQWIDFAGNQYEGIITAVEPQRVRVNRNPKDQANSPFWIWKWKIVFEVTAIIGEGIYFTSGVGP